MTIKELFLITVTIWISSIVTIEAEGEYSDRVRITEVQTITLTKGLMSTSRRQSAVPQLKCVGGSAGCSFVPNVVQCYNRGTDGVRNVQWECKAELPESITFGSMQVSCEGYDNKEDPYILVGSCGLEYKLESFNSPYLSNKATFLIFITFALLITAVVIKSKGRSPPPYSKDKSLLPVSIPSHSYYSSSTRPLSSSFKFNLSNGFATTSKR